MSLPFFARCGTKVTKKHLHVSNLGVSLNVGLGQAHIQQNMSCIWDDLLTKVVELNNGI